MVLWFAGLSFVLVWVAFRSPALDYRLVMAGALLPDLVDAPLGGARVAHTLLASAGLLALVMVVARGRRLRQRRLLAVPVGTFVHLLLDGVWGRARLFWWPFLGASFGGAPLPSAERGAGLLVAQELAGAVALWWCGRRFRFDEPEHRARFLRTGQLGRDLVA
jgi:hypothetical protein